MFTKSICTGFDVFVDKWIIVILCISEHANECRGHELSDSGQACLPMECVSLIMDFAWVLYL